MKAVLRHGRNTTGALLFCLIACASPVDEAAQDSTAQGLAVPAAGVTASLAVNAHWQNGYCANVAVRNHGGPAPVHEWHVLVDIGHARLFSQWSGQFGGTTGRFTIDSMSWNSRLGAGQDAVFGFCATTTSPSGLPRVVSVTVGKTAERPWGGAESGAGTSGAPSISGAGGATGGSASAAIGGAAGVAGESVSAAGTLGSAGSSPAIDAGGNGPTPSQINPENVGGTSPGSAGATSETGTAGAGGTVVNDEPIVGNGPDGCSDQLAAGVTLRTITINQSVAIPLATDGRAIPATSRSAPVVAGKRGVVVASVSVDSSWVPRELSARLVLTQGTGVTTTHWMRRRVSGPQGQNPVDGFQLPIDAADITPTTRYAVEIVDCAAAGGSSARPRFPQTGSEALGAVRTGPLQLVLIPMQNEEHPVDTSPAAQKTTIDLLQAMFPADRVAVTVGAPLVLDSSDFPVPGKSEAEAQAEYNQWTLLLNRLIQFRSVKMPTSDVYYIGWLTPAKSRAEYAKNGQYIGGMAYPVTNSADSDDRAIVALSWGDNETALATAHELGHAHGRQHAPCGIPEGADSLYPYSNAALGGWGWNAQTSTWFAPDTSRDLMSYCSPRWISDFTYRALADRIMALNTPATEGLAREARTLPGAPGSVEAARTSAAASAPGGSLFLMETATGLRWDTIRTTRPITGGQPVSATVLDATGSALTEITVQKREPGGPNPFGIAVYTVPEPQVGWVALRIGNRTIRFNSPLTP